MVKIKEEHTNKTIDDLSLRHKNEIKNLQDSNSETLKLISNERKRFSEETSSLLKNERNRLNTIHDQELYNKEKHFELS